MIAHDHLKLRVIQLKALGEWVHEQEGLVFVFPQAGAGNYVVGRIRQRVGHGDVVMSKAGKQGRIVALGRSDMVFACFFLSLEHLFPLFAAEEVALLETVADGLNVPIVYPASNPVAKECHHLLAGVVAEHSLPHRSQLLNLAAVLLTPEFVKARRQRVEVVDAEDQIRQTLANISAGELLSCSVEELAARFNCSRRHLNRLFRQYLGFSASALRMEMRMMRAVTLLRNPDAKVLNVAEQCGFNHLGLFNTCFKKRFGVTPTQWRQQEPPPDVSVFPAKARRVLCPLEFAETCHETPRPAAGKTGPGADMSAS